MTYASTISAATGVNPYFDASPTSLSVLSEHDWRILSNTWSRGIDWCVTKIGKKWMVSERISSGAPLFRTKKAAGDFADKLVLAESRHRSRLRWEADEAARLGIQI